MSTILQLSNIKIQEKDNFSYENIYKNLKKLHLESNKDLIPKI